MEAKAKEGKKNYKPKNICKKRVLFLNYTRQVYHAVLLVSTKSPALTNGSVRRRGDGLGRRQRAPLMSLPQCGISSYTFMENATVYLPCKADDVTKICEVTSYWVADPFNSAHNGGSVGESDGRTREGKLHAVQFHPIISGFRMQTMDSHV
ncbi:hypothetical protein KIN20_028268 [Parelaphostrongylus tenuis]|uniref:Uncharacterized protein n=1 Tax=Parelaphostrongylus tenuis TaxID=148309 RepID=A0AAD5R100_PARTN|nr:hypothetical protein KIN20_028268 [Parelaphostrongylus tenuis]